MLCNVMGCGSTVCKTRATQQQVRHSDEGKVKVGVWPAFPLVWWSYKYDIGNTCREGDTYDGDGLR